MCLCMLSQIDGEGCTNGHWRKIGLAEAGEGSLINYWRKIAKNELKPYQNAQVRKKYRHYAQWNSNQKTRRSQCSPVLRLLWLNLVLLAIIMKNEKTGPRLRLILMDAVPCM